LQLLKYIFFLALLFILNGCKKDHKILGVDVQPESDSISSTFIQYPVIGFTQKIDSVPSFNDRHKFIGSNNDPYFGRTDIGLYLNANMSVLSPFSSASTLTSAEIILGVDIDVKAGDPLASLTFSLFAIDSVLSSTRVYYTSNARLHNPNVLSVSNGGYSEKNKKDYLKIPVDYFYAEKILKDIANTANNDVFQAKYKGFYIKCSAGTNEGVIYKIDLEDDTSGFYLHYKDTILKTFRFTFSGSKSVKFNTVSYDPSTGAAALTSQLSGDTVNISSLFLKGMGQTRSKIYIPALRNMSDSFNVAINRAEVIFNLDPSFENATSKYGVPPFLSLLPVSVNSRDTFALDQLNTTDNSRYNGYYDLTNKRYVFNIARQVQAIVKGQKANRGFHLVISDPSKILTARRDNYIQRVVIAGNNNMLLKPVLNLSFVKFKKE
jgi:hypothetical protein